MPLYAKSSRRLSAGTRIDHCLDTTLRKWRLLYMAIRVAASLSSKAMLFNESKRKCRSYEFRQSSYL